MKKTNILFVCTGNSIRSQMAEGLARHLSGDEIETASAGISPGQVHPLAIETMAEIGIDISGHHTRPLSDYLVDEADIIISVCDEARPYCAMIPKIKKRHHWSIPDPLAVAPHKTKESFRDIRKQLKSLIEDLLAGMESPRAD